MLQKSQKQQQIVFKTSPYGLLLQKGENLCFLPFFWAISEKEAYLPSAVSLKFFFNRMPDVYCFRNK